MVQGPRAWASAGLGALVIATGSLAGDPSGPPSQPPSQFTSPPPSGPPSGPPGGLPGQPPSGPRVSSPVPLAESVVLAPGLVSLADLFGPTAPWWALPAVTAADSRLPPTAATPAGPPAPVDPATPVDPPSPVNSPSPALSRASPLPAPASTPSPVSSPFNNSAPPGIPPAFAAVFPRIDPPAQSPRGPACAAPQLIAQGLLLRGLESLDLASGAPALGAQVDSAPHYRVVLSVVDGSAAPCPGFTIYIAAAEPVTLQIQDSEVATVTPFGTTYADLCIVKHLVPGANETLTLNHYGRADFGIPLAGGPHGGELSLASLHVPELFLWTADMVADLAAARSTAHSNPPTPPPSGGLWAGRKAKKAAARTRAQAQAQSAPPTLKEIMERAVVFNPVLAPMHDLSSVTPGLLVEASDSSQPMSPDTAAHLSSFFRLLAGHILQSKPTADDDAADELGAFGQGPSAATLLVFDYADPQAGAPFDPRTHTLATTPVRGAGPARRRVKRALPAIDTPFALHLDHRAAGPRTRLDPGAGLVALHKRGLGDAVGHAYNGTAAAFNSMIAAIRGGGRRVRLKIGTLGTRLAVAIETHGGAVGRFIVKSVKQVLALFGALGELCFINPLKFFQKLGRNLNLAGMVRTAQFMDHFIRIRKQHIKDSLEHVGAKWANSSTDNMDAVTAPLLDVIHQFGAEEVRIDHLLKGVSKQGKSITVKGVTVDTPNDQSLKPHDVQSTFVENQLLSSLSRAQVSDTHRSGSSPLTKLSNVAGSFYREVMDFLRKNDYVDLMTSTNLLFKDGTSFTDKSVAWFMETIKVLVEIFGKAISHVKALSIAVMREMVDIFYAIFDLNVLLPVSLIMRKPMRLTLLQVYCYFTAPSVYTQYVAAKGADPISAADLALLTRVQNPMLMRRAWNTDNPSPALVKARDGVLDWIPRSMLVTLTWTCVLWAGAEENLAARLAAEPEAALTREAWRVTKWSRIFQNGIIGYLMGILVFPVVDVDDPSPAAIEKGLRNPYMKAWAMWAYWTAPVIWKSAHFARETMVQWKLKSRGNNVNDPEFKKYKGYLGRAESIFTGVPMVLAFSGILGDMVRGTDWKEPKRSATTILSFASWFFDGVSYFMMDPLFPQDAIWPGLYAMCGFYQLRVTTMEVFDVVGLMGSIDGPGITWATTTNGTDGPAAPKMGALAVDQVAKYTADNPGAAPPIAKTGVVAASAAIPVAEVVGAKTGVVDVSAPTPTPTSAAA